MFLAMLLLIWLTLEIHGILILTVDHGVMETLNGLLLTWHKFHMQTIRMMVHSLFRIQISWLHSHNSQLITIIQIGLILTMKLLVILLVRKEHLLSLLQIVKKFLYQLISMIIDIIQMDARLHILKVLWNYYLDQLYCNQLLFLIKLVMVLYTSIH
jgi:hypothetical protein